MDLTDVVTTSGIPREPQKHPEKKVMCTLSNFFSCTQGLKGFVRFN